MSNEIDLTVQDAQAFLETMNLSPEDWKQYSKRSDAEKLALGVYVMNLSMKGLSLRKIEEKTGIPRMTVSRYRDKALASIELPTVTAARALEIERLEALIEAVWPLAITGDKEAIASYMKISDRMGKITGTDRPIEISSTVVEVTAAERELAEMLAQAERDASMKAASLVESHVTL